MRKEKKKKEEEKMKKYRNKKNQYFDSLMCKLIVSTKMDRAHDNFINGFLTKYHHHIT